MSTNPPRYSGLAYALDPRRHFEVLGEQPDPWQSQVLRPGARKNIIACTSRQAGKSTVISILASNNVAYRPDRLVIVTAPVERQARELYRKILTCIKRTPGASEIIKENAREIELSNGSRVVCLPGKAEFIAGYSAPDLVIIDEACYAKDSLYNTVSPMLAVSGGRLVLISTPFVTSGFFYKIWTDTADDGWDRYEIPATSIPRISAEFLDKERRRLGDWWYNSQYLCRFQTPEDSLFTPEMIGKVFRKTDYKALLLEGDDPLYKRHDYKAYEVI
jgi:hypothetical protein